jgi:hypothetical protein
MESGLCHCGCGTGRWARWPILACLSASDHGENVAIKLILLPLGRLTSVVNMEQSNNGSGGRTPECNRPWAEQPTPILGPLRYRVDVYYPGLRADHLLSCPCKATRVSNPANHFAFVKYKNTSLGLPATVQAMRSFVSGSQDPSVLYCQGCRFVL